MFRAFRTVAILLGGSVSGVLHSQAARESNRWVPPSLGQFTATPAAREVTGMQVAAFGVASATFPVDQAAGKRIKFSGFIRTEEVLTGYAGLWWRVDGEDRKVLGFDNMSKRGAKGTSEWRSFSIELKVDAQATNINFGALLVGDGTAWFDDLKVEIDGKRFANGNLFDFGFEFESYPTLGFGFGGKGYQVHVTDRVKRSGAKSLQMTWMRQGDLASQPLP